MKLLVSIVVLSVIFAILGLPAGAEESRGVSTSGTATVTKKPDVAYITMYIMGDGILMADAVKKAGDKAEAIKKALGNLEVELSDVDIGDKEPRSYGRGTESPRPQVVKRVRITIPPDPAVACQIIDTAIREGAVMTKPSSLSLSGGERTLVYGLLDAAAAEDEAQKLALAEAKEKAKKIAEMAGQKAGGIQSINVVSGTSACRFVCSSGGEEKYPTEYIGVNPGTIDISSTVSVTFALIK